MSKPKLVFDMRVFLALWATDNPRTTNNPLHEWLSVAFAGFLRSTPYPVGEPGA